MTDLDDESDDLVYCPECRAEIFALAERCPACGHLILRDEWREAVDKRPAPKGIKLVALIVLGIGALLVAVAVLALLLK